MSTLTLTGEIFSLGDMPHDEVPQMAGVPHIGIRLADGRKVTLTGLTRDECRAMATSFMSPVVLTMVEGE